MMSFEMSRAVESGKLQISYVEDDRAASDDSLLTARSAAIRRSPRPV